MSNLSKSIIDGLRQSLTTSEQERAEAQASLASVAKRYDDITADLYKCQATQATLQEQLTQTQAQLQVALKHTAE